LPALWNAKLIPLGRQYQTSGITKPRLDPTFQLIGIVIAFMIQHEMLSLEQNYTTHAFYFYFNVRPGLPEGGPRSIHISFQKLPDKPNDFS